MYREILCGVWRFQLILGRTECHTYVAQGQGGALVDAGARDREDAAMHLRAAPLPSLTPVPHPFSYRVPAPPGVFEPELRCCIMFTVKNCELGLCVLVCCE